MTVRNDIDKYISYFKDKNVEIGNMSVLPIFKKILCLVEIDTLSRAAFSAVSGNKNRVMKFLDICSNWSDKNRVSATQLRIFLVENGVRAGLLLDLINDQINSWGYGKIIPPNEDLTFEEVQNLALEDDFKFVDEARYIKLFYRYRNSLIHEFREPGSGMDLGTESTTPYYLGMDYPNTSESSWELIFPLKFLESLCEGCLNGLEAYLIANNINPYDSYEFGSKWQRS